MANNSALPDKTKPAGIPDNKKPKVNKINISAKISILMTLKL
jgi:hypothetical protein